MATLQKPYAGKEPFIFISYAHKDMDSVMPIVAVMQEAGFRVWYDEGIDPGSEWRDFIAKKVKTCSCFISMMSQRYLDSKNCCKEMAYAWSKEKDSFIIYLEHVILPDGIEMEAEVVQNIHKYKYDNETDFSEKLLHVPMFEQCRFADRHKSDVSSVSEENHCLSCGAVIAKGTDYCEKCRKELPSSGKSVKNKKNVIAIIGLILSVLSIVLIPFAIMLGMLIYGIFCFCGLACSIIGLILSEKKKLPGGKMSVVGITLASISFFFFLLFLLFL